MATFLIIMLRALAVPNAHCLYVRNSPKSPQSHAIGIHVVLEEQYTNLPLCVSLPPMYLTLEMTFFLMKLHALNPDQVKGLESSPPKSHDAPEVQYS